MADLQQAKQHIIGLILKVDNLEDHEKLHTLVHSLEAVCHCIHTEQALLPFRVQTDQRPERPDEWDEELD